MNVEDRQAIMTFMRLSQRLKRVQRQGWIDRGVDGPESSADHSWSLALFSWLVARMRPGIDEDRVLLIALVHDLPEVLAGDATPFDRFRKADGSIPPETFRHAPSYEDAEVAAKHEQERAALVRMCAELPDDLALPMIDAWDEYTDGTTPEAQLVRQLDKMETLLQAVTYQDDQPDIVIESFRAGAARDVIDPELRMLLAILFDQTPQ